LNSYADGLRDDRARVIGDRKGVDGRSKRRHACVARGGDGADPVVDRTAASRELPESVDEVTPASMLRSLLDVKLWICGAVTAVMVTVPVTLAPIELVTVSM
jgi:hypothetical protein